MPQKNAIADLACFGGPPLFDEVRPIGQLAVPDEATFFRLSDRIYTSHRLSGNGELVEELERRLAAFHEVPHCVAYANASLAIVAVTWLLAKGRRGKVILPAFTYAGLPHLVRWAGQMPQFCDIDEETQTLDIEAVAAALDSDTTMILGVHQVTSPCHIDALEELSQMRAVPLTFDAVHGFGCTHHGRPIGRFGRAEIFSLHATKLLNGFEGGYVTTQDRDLADRLRALRDHDAGETIAGMGMNARLNEVHAACALASLERIDATITGNRRRVEAYERAFRGIQGLCWIGYADDGERKNYEFALLRVGAGWPLARDETVELLRDENALARPYYSPPVHRSPHHPHGLPVPHLPVTESLALDIIQMPVGERLNEDDIDDLAALFRLIAANGPAIAQRLRGGGGE